MTTLLERMQRFRANGVPDVPRSYQVPVLSISRRLGHLNHARKYFPETHIQYRTRDVPRHIHGTVHVMDRSRALCPGLTAAVPGGLFCSPLRRRGEGLGSDLRNTNLRKVGGISRPYWFQFGSMDKIVQERVLVWCLP